MFRFFFQGGFSEPAFHPRRRGHHGHAPRARHQEYHQAAADPKANVMSLLFAFLPFLIIILLNMFSGQAVQHYSMTKNNGFPYEKRTYRLRAPFFVNDSFAKLSQRDQANLMVEIDNEYYHHLYNECIKEHHRQSRYGRSQAAPAEGSWCHKFNEAKRVMQPGY